VAELRHLRPICKLFGWPQSFASGCTSAHLRTVFHLLEAIGSCHHRSGSRDLIKWLEEAAFGGWLRLAPLNSEECGLRALRGAIVEVRLPRMNLAPGYGEPKQGQVLGRVLLAGEVIEHDRGYRGERARITELIPERGQEYATSLVASRLGLPMSDAI
jgi:hypothetical protein